MSKTAEFITESEAMYKKGYRYFVTLSGAFHANRGSVTNFTETFYFKEAHEVGPFLRTQYPKAKMLKTGPIHGGKK
jgi:hypothetical protein